MVRGVHHKLTGLSRAASAVALRGLGTGTGLQHLGRGISLRLVVPVRLVRCGGCVAAVMSSHAKTKPNRKLTCSCPHPTTAPDGALPPRSVLCTNRSTPAALRPCSLVNPYISLSPAFFLFHTPSSFTLAHLVPAAATRTCSPSPPRLLSRGLRILPGAQDRIHTKHQSLFICPFVRSRSVGQTTLSHPHWNCAVHSLFPTAECHHVTTLSHRRTLRGASARFLSRWQSQ
jgi:hypothetical protein